MERWLFEEGCDGFNVMFPTVPEGLDDFVDKVVPRALQRRGLFRREYEGRTLRENLGTAAAGKSVLPPARAIVPQNGLRSPPLPPVGGGGRACIPAAYLCCAG